MALKYRDRPYGSKGITLEKILGLWNSGFSITEIALELDCSVQNIIKRLSKQGLYSISEVKKRANAKRAEKTKAQRKKWNPVDSKRVREKISKSIKSLYETSMFPLDTNPFYHFSLEQRRIYAQLGFRASCKKPTSLELKLIKIICENELSYRYVGNGSLWIAGMNPDFIHKKQNSVVEVLGTHWHNQSETKKRRERFNSYGFKFIELWETELDTLSESEIVQRLSV